MGAVFVRGNREAVDSKKGTTCLSCEKSKS